MNFKRISKSILCVALACFLVFNIVTTPARATGALAVIEGISTVLGPVGTVAAVTVIALGLWAGANPDDFDNIVDGVSAHLSEIGTNMKDGFVQMLQVTDSAGAKQLYVAAETLENVRSYLFSSGVISITDNTPAGSFNVYSSEYTFVYTRTSESYVILPGTSPVHVYAFSWDRPNSDGSPCYNDGIVFYSSSSFKLTKPNGTTSTISTSTFFPSGFYEYHIGYSTVGTPSYAIRSDFKGFTWSKMKSSLNSQLSQVLSSGSGSFVEESSSYDISLGVVSDTTIVDDVSVYDSTWNANQLRVAVADPENNEPNYKVYLPVPLPSNYEDLHSVTQSDVLTGAITGVPDLGEDEEYVIEELPIVDGYQGVIVSPSDTQSGTQSGTTTGAVTLPGWLSDGINNLLQGLKDILNTLLSLPAALWAALPAWLTEGVSNMVTGLRDILDAIKALPGAIAEAMADVITGALTKAFAISDTFIASKVEALTLKYPYLDTFLALGADLKAFFLGLGTTPPVIYINLGASEGSYNIGGQEVFMDLSWYARYKPTMDAVIGGFIWLWLAWRIYLSIPGIISGASGVWGSITRHSERSMKNNSKENAE